MAEKKKKMVTAVFRNRNDSEQAFEYLYNLGYADREINVLMSDRTHTALLDQPLAASKLKAGTKAEEGMGIGGAIGTAVGATLAAVAAIGTSIALPGIGTGIGLVIAGPIAAAFAGGGAGAVTGGLIGALVGAGFAEQNAAAYEEALRDGGVVLGVVPSNREHANAIMERFKELNGENVCYH
jgi:hypothetical protein